MYSYQYNLRFLSRHSTLITSAQNSIQRKKKNINVAKGNVCSLRELTVLTI